MEAGGSRGRVAPQAFPCSTRRNIRRGGASAAPAGGSNAGRREEERVRAREGVPREDEEARRVEDVGVAIVGGRWRLSLAVVGVVSRAGGRRARPFVGFVGRN